MATFTGTSHFVSERRAVEYYQEYSPYAPPYTIRDLVKLKIKEGEITIGKPKVNKCAKLAVNKEGRYIIESP